MDIGAFLISLVQSPLFLISIGFWLVALILIKLLGKKKELVTLFFPFLILIRWKKLNRLFQRIPRRHPKIWRVIWNIGVVLSFCLMLYALYFFISNFVHLIVNPQPENAILPLIPGVTIDLPMFTALIVPLLLNITVHEFSHAIAAETDGVHVKSSGIMGIGAFFIIGYGAFVEVDEFQLNSKTYSTGTRLRVAAAGVFANILLAGIVFLLLNSFTGAMNLSYQAPAFQVTEVLPNSQGGFNEGNIFAGDIVTEINGTDVFWADFPTLDDVLTNQTDLQCSVGDTLIFTCYNPETRGVYNRSIVLGWYSYIGLDYAKYNNTAFQITGVDDVLYGGNNDNPALVDQIITKINGTQVNYVENNTLTQILSQNRPNYQLDLTSVENISYTVDVNYFPDVAAAHLLRDVFIGMNVTQTSDSSIIISTVLSNSTEGGINEGRIPEGTIITAVNQIPLNLSTQSLKDFIASEIGPQPGDILTFQTSTGENFTINTAKIPIKPVYVGIYSQSYWIPKNWIGRLFGPFFPYKYYDFLLYTWMISLSLALFNLLPTAIFDGGRMMKEVIHKIFGSEYETDARKKLRYEYDENSVTQHLYTHHIHKIHSCRLISAEKEEKAHKSSENSQKTSDGAEPIDFVPEIPDRELEFTAMDSSTDGFLDTIEITAEPKPPHKALIEVDVEYERDLKEKPKKLTYRIVSYLTAGIVLASLIISVIKFNNTLFWL